MEEKIIQLLRERGAMKPQAIADALCVTFVEVCQCIEELEQRQVVYIPLGYMLDTETPPSLHVMLRNVAPNESQNISDF